MKDQKSIDEMFNKVFDSVDFEKPFRELDRQMEKLDQRMSGIRSEVDTHYDENKANYEVHRTIRRHHQNLDLNASRWKLIALGLAICFIFIGLLTSLSLSPKETQTETPPAIEAPVEKPGGLKKL